MFKNLQIVDIKENQMSDEFMMEFKNSVLANEFVPCAKTQEVSIGWVGVTDDIDDECYVSIGSDVVLMRMRKEQRVVPASAITEELKKRVAIDEARLGSDVKLSAKRKAVLKNEVVYDLLPQVLPKSVFVSGYVDLSSMRIVIDSSSQATAEEFVTLLRKSMPNGLVSSFLSVPSVEVGCVLTNWLSDSESLPATLGYGEDCKLVGDAKSSLVFKNYAINRPEVKYYLTHGMFVDAIGLCCNNRVLFSLDTKLSFKRILSLEGTIDVDSEQDSVEADDSKQNRLLNLFANLTITVDLHRDLVDTVVLELNKK